MQAVEGIDKITVFTSNVLEARSSPASEPMQLALHYCHGYAICHPQVVERQCQHHKVTSPGKEGMAAHNYGRAEVYLLGTQKRVVYDLYE